jgi:hypothetical protein
MDVVSRGSSWEAGLDKNGLSLTRWKGHDSCRLLVWFLVLFCVFRTVFLFGIITHQRLFGYFEHMWLATSVSRQLLGRPSICRSMRPSRQHVRSCIGAAREKACWIGWLM